MNELLTWYEIGNGWRNLYVLSCLMQALALGVAFAAHGLVSRRKPVAFLAGAASTPFAQYLWMLLLALVWPAAPRMLIIAALPAASCLYLLIALVKRRARLAELAKKALARVQAVVRMDRLALFSWTLALAMALLLLPPTIRLCIQCSGTYSDEGEYLALAQRYCGDRDLALLMDKSDGDGSFRPNAHFPSLELYFAYGLMHTSEAEVGYPYDKPVFTGIGFLSFYMTAAFLAALLQAARGRWRWVALGALLFNMVPRLYESVVGAPRDIFRVLATLLLLLWLWELRPKRGARATLGLCALLFALCFTIMSAHVLMFVILPFLVVAWVLACAWEGDGIHALWRATLAALCGAAGTLLAFAGNIWCYLQWGTMSAGRVLNDYTTAPWYEAYQLSEYRLVETTTRIDFIKSFSNVLQLYQSPVGLWGLVASLLALCCAVALTLRRRLNASLAQSGSPQRNTAVFAGLSTVCALAPMAGLIDIPTYSFSGVFLYMQRYAIQWFALCCLPLVAMLSWGEKRWPDALRWLRARLGSRSGRALSSLRSAPALLCALLCLFGFVRGTSQNGYDQSCYRYSRSIVEDESYILDNGFLARYGTLLKLAPLVADDQKILYANMGEQYPLRGRGYSLTANPIAPLLNTPLDEVGEALERMNVAMLVTDQAFWDERFFSQSYLSEYLNALPPEQIVEDEVMRFYLIDASLSEQAAALLPPEDERKELP